MRKKVEKLTVDLPKEIKQEIKIFSAKRFITMRSWVVNAILQAIMEERQFDK